MTTTLILLGLIFVMAVFVFTVDWLERRAKRSNRQTVRRVQRYLDSLPPGEAVVKKRDTSMDGYVVLMALAVLSAPALVVVALVAWITT